jgi:L-lactate dehydrogenase complex protein LldF
MEFKARAGQKLADQRLQQNLKKLSTKFVTARADAIRDIDFDATRAALKERRNRARESRRLAGQVRGERDEAWRHGVVCRIDRRCREASGEIAQKHGVKKVIKSKSMVTEEMRLNQVLARWACRASRPISASTSCRSTMPSRRRTSSRR